MRYQLQPHSSLINSTLLSIKYSRLSRKLLFQGRQRKNNEQRSKKNYNNPMKIQSLAWEKVAFALTRESNALEIFQQRFL